MGNLTIDGTVRAVRETDTRKKDVDRKQGALCIMNEDGDKVDIKGAISLTKGFNPEDQVTVTVARSNKTIVEATEE